MEQSSSLDEKRVRHQFDRRCKPALKGELVDYKKHMDYLSKHEVILSDFSGRELNNLSVIDEYEMDFYHIQMLGYDKKH